MAEDKRSEPNQYVFAYRPSMLKYKNGPTWLEINGYAKNPTRARLNCAFIILLLTLGTQITVRYHLLKPLKVVDLMCFGTLIHHISRLRLS